MDPTLLVADEPTGNLDAHAAADVLTLLQRLNQEAGKTVIIVTHDPKAAAYARRTAIWRRAKCSTATARSGHDDPGFIVRNALRNKRRLILTVLSVALSLFLFTTLQTALHLMTHPPTTEERRCESPRTSSVAGKLLPAKYQFRIERMPGEVLLKVHVLRGYTKTKARVILPSSPWTPIASSGSSRNDRITAGRGGVPQGEDRVHVGPNCWSGLAGRLATRSPFRDDLGCDPELTIRGTYRGQGIDETLCSSITITLMS